MTTVPHGYYAGIVMNDADLTEQGLEEEGPYVLLGYELLNVNRRGGRKLRLQPYDADTDREALRRNSRGVSGSYGLYEFLAEHPEYQQDAMEQYGQLTGRCGCCHRTLTDPQSKLRGIGPDCWKALV